MRKNHPIVLLIAVIICFAGCGGGGGGDSTGDLFPARIEIPGVGPNGIFDPSPAGDGSGRVWMSYSEVVPSPQQSTVNQIFTRVAFSDDGGLTWTDSGSPVNPATAGPPLPAPYTVSVWQQEVSNLKYDPFDTVSGEPWKMVWHRYLAGYNSLTGRTDRLFENGWIALKTSGPPPGNFQGATERKLFAGNFYNSGIDVILGPPEFQLDVLFPGPDALGECAVFTEPGMVATQKGLFIAMRCGKLSGPGKNVLMLCSHDFSTCDYVGDLLDDTEASLFGANYDGFSAPELVQVGSQTYLIVTPTENDFYRGCLVFRVTDLGTDIATLKQTELVERAGDANNTPVLVSSLFGTSGSFNGACGYSKEVTGSGIIYSEFFVDAPQFQLFASGENL